MLADRTVDLATLVEDDDALAEHVRDNVGGMFHVVGTCRMGPPNDRMTVVDPTGRVRGLSGLRVVDASIMPTLPRGNTNLPTLMLAEKVADAIARRLEMSAEARLKQLGIVLPKVPTPVANYVPFRLVGNLLYLSGQGPRDENGGFMTGKVDSEVSVDEAYKRARIVGLGLLAATREALGSLDRVEAVDQAPRHGQLGADVRQSAEGDQRLLRPVRRGVRRCRPPRPFRRRHGGAAEPDLGRDRGDPGRQGLNQRAEIRL